MTARPTHQLKLDGTEVPVAPASPAPLTEGQRAILRALGEKGSLRSVEAGEILLETLEKRPWARQSRRRYASADGSMAMRRLMKRGLVKRGDKDGVWVPV
jgi:DNA-binding MarR family transcriptional regulator